MRFEKVLTKNDVGATHSHQAGFLIPKGMSELLEFLPFLDPSVKNPSCILRVVDDSGRTWDFRYVYYNNKLHSKEGTRNEYRITCTTAYMRQNDAREGDTLVLSMFESDYRIAVKRTSQFPRDALNRVRLKGWTQLF